MEKEPIYIFDASDNLLAITTKYIEAPFEETVNEAVSFEFTIPSDDEDAQHVVGGNQVAFRDLEGCFRLFIVRETNDEDGENGPIKRALCLPGMDELNDHIIEDKRPYNVTATVALTDILARTRYQVGNVADLGTASANLYYVTGIKALSTLVNTWGGEVVDRIEIDDTGISGRFIDIVYRRGVEIGKRFEIDKDIESITRTVDFYPKTALYGRGSSIESGDGFSRKITFADIEWSVANGDPADKPLGQEWIGDAEALSLHGITQNDGSKKHRFGAFEDGQEKDPATLLQKSWDALQGAKEPKAYYEMSVQTFEGISGYEHELVRLGDTGHAIVNEIQPPILIEARVMRMKYDIGDPTDAEISLGNYLDLYEDDRKLEELENRLNDNAGLWGQEPTITDSNFPDDIPPVPTNFVANGLFKIIQLMWDYDSSSYIAAYEIYASQIAGFVPDSTNLVWKGKTGGYSHNADVNQQWYFRIRAVNTHGTPSAFTNEIMGQTVRIQNIDIAIGAVNADKLADLAVTAAKLADGSVGTQKILDDAIQAAKIAANSVTELKIANGAISNTKLANLSVDAAKLANSAVTNLKIFDGAVTETKIANLAISAGKLKDGIVDDTKLANLAVTAGKLADGSVTNAKVGNSAINNAKLADLAVNAAKLEAGSVNDTKLDRTTIDRIVIGTADIANLAVGTAAISTGAITNAKIANLAVDTAEIADAAVQSAKIANLAVGNAAIANLAVSSGKIQDLAVGNAAIANGAITNAKIGSLAVDTANLANAAITNAKIANLAVGTAAIQDLAVTNAKVQRLSADKVTIGGGTSFDPNFDPTTKETPTGAQAKVDAVEIGGRNYFTKSTGVSRLAPSVTVTKDETNAPNGFMLTGVSSGASVRLYDVIKSNGEWTVSFKAKASAISTIGTDICDATGITSLSLTTEYQEFSFTGNVTNYSGVYDFVDLDELDAVDYWFTNVKVEKGNKATDWTPAPEDVQADIGQAEQDAKEYRDLWAYPNTTYIDGGNIYTNSVTANEMATNTITAASGIIADAAITTAKIANLAVGNAAIANGAIDNAKIANLAVDTANLANAAITNAKIANLSVDSAKIADAAITDAKISNLSANKITTGSLTGVTVISDDGAGNKVQLSDGTISSFQNNKLVAQLNERGVSVFARDILEEVGRLRDAQYGDATTKGIDIISNRERLSLSFDTNNDGVGEPILYASETDLKTILYGSNKTGSATGRLRLNAVGASGVHGSDVPAIEVDNFDDTSKWGNVMVRTGRGSDAGRGGNERFGFEVWQYLGDSSGGQEQMLKIDRGADGLSYTEILTTFAYLPADTKILTKRNVYNYAVNAFVTPDLETQHGSLNGSLSMYLGETTITADSSRWAYRDINISFAENIFMVQAMPYNDSSVYFTARVYSQSSTGFRIYLPYADGADSGSKAGLDIKVRYIIYYEEN